MSGRPPKHGASRFSRYLDIHETVLARYRSQGFVDGDAIKIERFGRRHFLMQGEIACRGNIVIAVDKMLEACDREPDPLVQTVLYSYNVYVKGKWNVFRYDNQHPGWRYPGHNDEHHCHVFDWGTGNELPGSPKWIGAAGWPTLGEVIDEARNWHADNYARLPDPEQFVTDLSSELR
ncbi:MAG TPA: DUF6516 family protein [Pirellulales bacterium]|nr:DUF6516 family protein [Pirellulales bacterium]